MAGYLSSLFGGGDTQQSQAADQHLAAHDGADLDQTIAVHQEVGGSYDTPDGTTHDFSSSHDLAVSVSAHVLVAAVVDTAEGVGGSAA